MNRRGRPMNEAQTAAYRKADAMTGPYHDVLANGADGGCVDIGRAWKQAEPDFTVLLIAPELPRPIRARLFMSSPDEPDMVLAYETNLGSM